jgi:Uma2 family endonuclease
MVGREKGGWRRAAEVLMLPIALVLPNTPECDALAETPFAMSTILEPPPAMWTVAEVYRRFGAMPLWRIGFDPSPGTATEDDVDRLEQDENELYELIDGILLRKTMSSYESLLGGRLLTLLNLFVLPRKLGWVLGADGQLRLWPGRVRIPDVCFIARSQSPTGQFPRGKRIASLFPDLAIEVLSESNTQEEMTGKLADYFQSGTRLVWYLDPDTETADVFTALDRSVHLTKSGVLTGDPVLPGLTIPLATVFEIDSPLE